MTQANEPTVPKLTKADVLNVLARHQGRANGISMDALFMRMGSPPSGQRELRRLITELREEGMGICGHPSSGYFVAQTPEELNMSCEFLHRRAMKSLVLASRMQRISLPTLLGQLFINQA